MFVSLVLHFPAVCTCGVALQECPTWPPSTWPSVALMPGAQCNDSFVAAIIEISPSFLLSDCLCCALSYHETPSVVTLESFSWCKISLQTLICSYRRVLFVLTLVFCFAVYVDVSDMRWGCVRVRESLRVRWSSLKSFLGVTSLGLWFEFLLHVGALCFLLILADFSFAVYVNVSDM